MYNSSAKRMSNLENCRRQSYNKASFQQPLAQHFHVFNNWIFPSDNRIKNSSNLCSNRKDFQIVFFLKHNPVYWAKVSINCKVLVILVKFIYTVMNKKKLSFKPCFLLIQPVAVKQQKIFYIILGDKFGHEKSDET